MLIIIDGVPATGRRQLGEALQNMMHKSDPRHVVELRDRLEPRAHPLDMYEANMRHHMTRRSDRLIINGYHWNEALNLPGRLPEYGYDNIMRTYTDMVLNAHGALIIHAIPTDEQIRTWHLDSRGERLTQDDLNWMRHRMALYARDSLVPVETIRLGNLSTTALHFLVSRAGALGRNAYKNLSGMNDYVGSPSPRLVLLGNKSDFLVGSKVRTLVSGAGKMSPYPGSTMHFLLDALRRVSTPSVFREIGISLTGGSDTFEGSVPRQDVGAATVALGNAVRTRFPRVSRTVASPLRSRSLAVDDPYVVQYAKSILGTGVDVSGKYFRPAKR